MSLLNTLRKGGLLPLVLPLRGGDYTEGSRGYENPFFTAC